MTNFQQLIEHFDRQELREAKRMMQRNAEEAIEGSFNPPKAR